jgi:hypothetical protein
MMNVLIPEQIYTLLGFAEWLEYIAEITALASAIRFSC